MKISIITCTWNSEPFLAASIESVLSQNYANIEYIFVDGGSTDGTLERISSVTGNIILLQEVQGGISKAMNEGWKVATGDVIAHLHSDDYYLNSNVLSKVAEAFSNGAGWAFGRIVRDIGGLLIPENYVAPIYSKHNLLRMNFIPHPATFVRREWMERVNGFDELLKYAMDYDLWLKLASLGDPLILSGELAAFREHNGSLSTRNRLAAMDENYLVQKRFADRNLFTRVENFARFQLRRRRVLRTMRQKTAMVEAKK